MDEESKNLVKYMENLEDDKDNDGQAGIEGDEIVNAQIGTHQWRGSESSNLHIGELHWLQKDSSVSGNPSRSEVTPNPHLEIEVDYYEGIGFDRTKVRSILNLSERNWNMYGVDIEYEINENSELTDSDLIHLGLFTQLECLENLPPTNLGDARCIEINHHGDASKGYMYISTAGDGFFFDKLGAASSDGNPGSFRDITQGKFGTVVFTGPHVETRAGLVLEAAISKTIIHETGHLLSVGNADDSMFLNIRFGEVYSGEDGDPTPEVVNGFENRNDVSKWSVMSEGYPDVLTRSPVDTKYTPFSIEEISTLETASVEKGYDK